MCGAQVSDPPGARAAEAPLRRQGLKGLRLPWPPPATDGVRTLSAVGRGLCFDETFVGFFFFLMFKLSKKYVC